MAGLLRLAVEVRAGEVRALFWAFAYFFCLLAAYFILRPLRDEMGIAGGVRALPWLFSGTFLAMLGAVPLFGFVVARFPRRRFIPYVYWFFIFNIVGFWVLLGFVPGKIIWARAFFIWTSVFNLFVVSVFWSFMSDIFGNARGRRLFGFIAAGGTLGTIVGPAVTVVLAVPLGTVNLLLISAGLLMAALFCMRRLTGAAPTGDGAERDPEIIGGGIFAGLTHVARSPYLLGISLFIALFTATSTFLYFQQANLIVGAFADGAERTRVFAFIDLSVSVLTVITQLTLTGRFIKYLGLRPALAFLPLVTMVGFVFFALAPTLAMLVVFQILRRASNFAITRPGREMLFTVISREEKYKSKNFIDTVVYRGGDAVSGWVFSGLARGLGLDLAAIAAICVPLAALWAVLAWMLGTHQGRLAEKEREKVP